MKNIYTAPQLTVYGDVEEITMGRKCTFPQYNKKWGFGDRYYIVKNCKNSGGNPGSGS